MSRCIDNNIGIKLHGYEMGQLSGDQADQFELHLLECKSCFEQAAKFEPAIDMLRSDPDLKSIVAEAADRQANKTLFITRLLSQLWPKTSILLRPAVAYFLLVLMIYPAYMGLKEFGRSSADEVVLLVLTSTRATVTPIEVGDQSLVILFRINGASQGDNYIVEIISDDGTQLYFNDSFTSIDEHEMASLLLHSEGLASGNYSLEIHRAGDDIFELKYLFSIK